MRMPNGGRRWRFRLKRAVLAGCVSLVLTLPLLILATELSYYAFPSELHEPGSSIGYFRSEERDTILLLFFSVACAISISLSWVVAPTKCMPSTAYARAIVQFSFPIVGLPLLIALAIGLIMFVVRIAFGEGFVDSLQLSLLTAAWMLPWIVITYLFRLRFRFTAGRPAAWGLYIIGFLLLAAIAYVMAVRLGDGDGVGQAATGLIFGIGMAVFISVCLADLLVSIPSGLTRAGPKSSSA